MLNRFLILIISLYAFAAESSLNSDLIKIAKNYLDQLDQVAIDFHQLDKNKKTYYGKLIISKPHNFRWNYYEPFPVIITGNESFVNIYDYDMEQLTTIDPKENIFQFIMNNQDLDNNFAVLEAYEKNLQYHLLIKHKEFDKRVHMIFSKSPLQIKSLIIIDVDSSFAEIIFDKIENIKNISHELFKIKNPEIFGKPTRYSKKDLEKYYDLRS